MEHKPIFVIELKLDGITVYKLETTNRFEGRIEFKQYLADALTGKEIEG